MAADLLRFTPDKDLSVTRTGINIASELLQALGELAVAQETGGTHESLDNLGQNVDAAFRRMNEFSELDSAA